VVFLTNNPLQSAAAYARRLAGLGVPAAESEILTPLSVLTTYLQARHSGVTVLTVAEPLVDQTLLEAGIRVTTEPSEAGVVVVSFDRGFDYRKLLRAFRAVRSHGAAIVATNPDPFCPTPDGGLPDCAAMLAAVEACTGERAEAVLGKPGPQMAAEVNSRLSVPPGDAAMVGDRVLTDVAMSRALGMTSVLVLSGATAAADIADIADVGGPADAAGSELRPDYVISGIGQLLPDSGASKPTDGSAQ
jgi:HAD superfamily hydrolase (TIGR01450 family)